MAQLHDPSRLVGRTALIVENGTPIRARIVTAGAGGISLQVGDERRFIGLDELHDVEFDVDDTHIANASNG